MYSEHPLVEEVSNTSVQVGYSAVFSSGQKGIVNNRDIWMCDMECVSLYTLLNFNAEMKAAYTLILVLILSISSKESSR